MTAPTLEQAARAVVERLDGMCHMNEIRGRLEFYKAMKPEHDALRAALDRSGPALVQAARAVLDDAEANCRLHLGDAARCAPYISRGRLCPDCPMDGLSELRAALDARGGEPVAQVAGAQCERSLADMERAACVLLDDEALMSVGGSALAGLLSDVVRLCRETARGGEPEPEPCVAEWREGEGQWHCPRCSHWWPYRTAPFEPPECVRQPSKPATTDAALEQAESIWHASSGEPGIDRIAAALTAAERRGATVERERTAQVAEPFAPEPDDDPHHDAALLDAIEDAIDDGDAHEALAVARRHLFAAERRGALLAKERAAMLVETWTDHVAEAPSIAAAIRARGER